MSAVNNLPPTSPSGRLPTAVPDAAPSGTDNSASAQGTPGGVPGDTSALSPAGQKSSMTLPGAPPSPPPQPPIGNAVVDGARALISNGYVYPPDLSANYRHVPGKVGCCADFVCDAYAEMAKTLNQPQDDIGADMAAKGFNPHYCPSMVQYFQQHQQLIAPPSKGGKAHVGDAVFFDWGDGQADHTAIVTKVDDQGRPIQIAESYNFNLPAKLTDLTPGQGEYNNIMAFGRVKDAGSNDQAAYSLPDVGNPAPAGPSSGGDSSGASSGGSSGISTGGSASAVGNSSGGRSSGGASFSPDLGAGAALVAATDPYADFPSALKQALRKLGHPPDPQKLAALSQQYGIPVDRMQSFCKAGPLPTDLAEGAHGGQCGAWMMGERGKMGLPTWNFNAAKDLLWNYPKDKLNLVKSPKPGDVFIMTNGQYGHTGFVQSVDNDGTVTVMDSNWGFDEKTHIHKIPLSQIAAYLEDK